MDSRSRHQISYADVTRLIDAELRCVAFLPSFDDARARKRATPKCRIFGTVYSERATLLWCVPTKRKASHGCSGIIDKLICHCDKQILIDVIHMLRETRQACSRVVDACAIRGRPPIVEFLAAGLGKSRQV